MVNKMIVINQLVDSNIWKPRLVTTMVTFVTYEYINSRVVHGVDKPTYYNWGGHIGIVKAFR